MRFLHTFDVLFAIHVTQLKSFKPQQSAGDPKLQRNLSASQFLVPYAATESSERLLDALRLYQTAMKRLIENDPNNTVWQDDLAGIHNTIGLFLQHKGDLLGALQEHRAALAVMEPLASNDPENATWQAGLANSDEGISSILQAQGDMNSAIDIAIKARAIWQTLVTQDPHNPDWKYHLAMNNLTLASARGALGDPISALSNYTDAESALQDLTDDVTPDYLEWQYQLALTKHMSGGVLLQHSDSDAAREKFRQGYTILQDLTARNPRNAVAQSLLAESLSSLALFAENHCDAFQNVRDAQAIRTRLVSQDPDNTDLQSQLAESHNEVGEMLQADGDLSGALSGYRAAQEILEHLTHNNSGFSLWRMTLIGTYCATGQVLAAQNDFDKALAAYRSAQELAKSMTGHVDDFTLRLNLSTVVSGIGSVKFAQGDLAGALEAYQENRSIVEHLSNQRPSMDDLKLQVALSHKIIGLLLMKQGDYVTALETFRAASSILEPLVRRDPGNMQKWALLSETNASLIEMSHTLRRYGDSAIYAQKAVELLREHQAKMGKDDSELAAALGNLSFHYILTQQFKDAEAAAKEGYAFDGQKSWILLNLVHAEMFLGHIEPAMELHLQHLNDVIPENGNKRWGDVIIDDFAVFKEAGLPKPNMTIIERRLAEEKQN